MKPLLVDRCKLTRSVTAVPREDLVRFEPMTEAPMIGDVALAEVIEIGHHKNIETPQGYNHQIFPGDLIVGSFGNRYATDQFESYVPDSPCTACDLSSIGGVFGSVKSANSVMLPPTTLKIVGQFVDGEGRKVNTTRYGLTPHGRPKSGKFILVVGSSMNAGKTTSVGTIVRALKQGGEDVAAVKVTGTAAGKDGRYFSSCGADAVYDFVDAGYPSTYLLSRKQLTDCVHSLLETAWTHSPHSVVVEIADGLLQRETDMLLRDRDIFSLVDHLFFAASDALSAKAGVEHLHSLGYKVDGILGLVTMSALAMSETRLATGLPCLDIESAVGGGIAQILRASSNMESAHAAI